MQMYKLDKSIQYRKGLSLVETITVLAITAMLIMAVLQIYGRVKDSAASINSSLDKNVLPREILHKIAEDLDKLAATGLDTTITINNKFDGGYNTAQMIIENKIYDKKNEPQIFEKIVWQSHYDPFEDSLVLYRSHSGLNLEDKVTDNDLAEVQAGGSELFIPLAAGITLFKIEVPKDETFLEKWTEKKLPQSIVVTISFTEPIEIAPGQTEIPEEEMTQRTIAIDRTKKIQYIFVKKDVTEESVLDEIPEEAIEKDEPNEIE